MSRDFFFIDSNMAALYQTLIERMKKQKILSMHGFGKDWINVWNDPVQFNKHKK